MKEKKNIYTRLLIYILIVAILNTQTACTTYLVDEFYFSDNVKVAKHLEKSKKKDKYFILHGWDFVTHLYNLTIDKTDNTLHANYEPVSPQHKAYEKSEIGKNYAEVDEYAELEETHIKVNRVDTFPGDKTENIAHECHLILKKPELGRWSGVVMNVYVNDSLIYKGIGVSSKKDTIHKIFHVRNGELVKFKYIVQSQYPSSNTMEFYSIVDNVKNQFIRPDKVIDWESKSVQVEVLPRLVVQLNDIVKVEEYTDITTRHAAGLTFGVLGLGFLAVVIILILTKSSCPLVYINMEGNSVLLGELFAGSFYPKLERNDCLNIPVRNDFKDTVKLSVINKFKEKQFINQIKCTAIEHNIDEKIYPDYYGNLYKVKDEIKPSLAQNERGVSLMNYVSEDDSLSWDFSDAIIGDKDLKELIVHFENKQKAKQGQLILNVKNTFLLDYAYYKFTELAGYKYNQFVKLQKLKSKKELIKWSEDQHIPLKISILDKDSSWKLIEYLPVVGPMEFKKLIIPVDLSNATGNIMIKLESGNMFWEIDEIKIDYTKQGELIKTSIPIYLNDGSDAKLTKCLTNDDNSYYVQDNIGDEVQIKFLPIQPKESKSVSYFLEAKGYYEHIRDFDNEPQISHLKKFKEKGYFVKFTNGIKEHLSKKETFLSKY